MCNLEDGPAVHAGSDCPAPLAVLHVVPQPQPAPNDTHANCHRLTWVHTILLCKRKDWSHPCTVSQAMLEKRIRRLWPETEIRWLSFRSGSEMAVDAPACERLEGLVVGRSSLLARSASACKSPCARASWAGRHCTLCLQASRQSCRGSLHGQPSSAQELVVGDLGLRIRLFQKLLADFVDLHLPSSAFL